METMQLVEKLMCFGMTRQEATIYICLVKHCEMTGYEAAKQTGISRSNAYNALAGLVDKGAAYTTEDTAVHYYAVEAEEFLSNKIKSLEEIKEQLKKDMPKVISETVGYLTITGDRHILDKIRNMLTQAKHRIYLSMTKKYIQWFAVEIAEAAASGKKVVVITDAPVEMEGTICISTEPKGRQIGVISDSAYVLTGEIGLLEESTCLYSGQPNFVQVFKDSLRNEIKLIQIMKGEPQ